MMMTASIAIGIAVDGSLHFLVHYQERYKERRDTRLAVEYAFSRTGGPIVQAALVAGLGMFPLMLSSFAPTVRFGGLMALTLILAMIADVILLPALFCLRPKTLLGWLKKPQMERVEIAQPTPDVWLNPPHVQLAPMSSMKVGKI
jgi:predicted RND superfamily exporter protein